MPFQSYSPNMSMAPNQSLVPLNYTPANFTPAPQYYQPQLNPVQTQSFWKQYSTPQVAPRPTAPVVNKPAPPKPPAPPKGGKGGKVLGATDTNNGFSEEQKYINDVYQGSLDTLNQQRGTLQSQYDQNVGLYGSYFDPQYQNLQNAYTSAQNLNAQNVTQAKQGQQSAIDQASSLYGELQQRNQQLYGGSSSAGQFGSELQGRQLQQNVGDITSTTANNIQTLHNQLNDINNNYQTQKSSLDQQKNATLIQLQQDFQNALGQIDQQQNQIGTDKASAKYQALKDFNANKQAILQHAQTLAEQLGTQALGARQQIQASIDQYSAQQGQTPNLSNLPGAQYSTALPQADTSGGYSQPALSPYLKKYYGLG